VSSPAADETFARVRDYLHLHGSRPMAAVAEACGLTLGDLARLVEAGRLSEVGEKAEHVRCELCGGVVAGLPLCGPCRERLSAPLHEAGLLDDVAPAAEPTRAATEPRARRRHGIAHG
jgi:hypothetical protein